MKGKFTKRLLAAAMSSVMTAAVAVPMLTANVQTAIAADTEALQGKVIYSTDFEDGDVSAFSNRGGDDTTQISASTDVAASGSTSLLASGRTQSWNGPAFRLDEKCEPNTEYYVNFKFRGKYYTGATISFQYNDPDGTPHYKNLIQNISTSDWYSVKNLKVSFTEEMQNVTVYIEGGQDDIYIDDFSVTEVPEVPIETDLKSIRAVYADKFKIGTAITPDNLSSKSFMKLVEKHFSGSLTAGNEMKPDSVLNQTACLEYVEETGDDTNPQISFSAARPFLNYCQKNNIPVRVHTLVWHSQTPDWFFKEGYKKDGDWVTPEKMKKRMENYIKNYFTELVKLYPDIDFYACDVVNEAFTDQGVPRQPGEQGDGGSENSAWVKVFGDNSFIEYAFDYAREYAPAGCKLYYNDYNEWSTGKTKAMVDLATKLKAKGTLDGLGLQCHCNITSVWPQPFQYDQLLTTLEKTGVDIQVTEFDATIERQSEETYQMQKEFFAEMMNIMEKHSDSISAVVFWGVTDDRSWRAKDVPLLFDGNYKAKSAYYGVVGDREEKELPTNPTKPTNPEKVEVSLYGDANGDKETNISDAVLIMQYLANQDKYSISKQGLANADCVGNDGVTSMDALAIQIVEAKTLTVNDLPTTQEKINSLVK